MTSRDAATSSAGRCSPELSTAPSIPRTGRPDLHRRSAQNKNGNAFTDSHWATFSPRIGLVWDPKGDGKQTIRASFFLMHETTELFYPERWTTNPPYVSSLTLNSGQFSERPFSNPFHGMSDGKPGDPFPGAAVFPSPAPTSAFLPTPGTYVMQWNLSYQRQLRHGLDGEGQLHG